MIAYVFKKRRRVGGKLVVSDTWHAALRLDWEHGQPRVWSLGTTDKREAERQLHEERVRREKEHCGMLPSRTQQKAAEMPLDGLLDAFLAEATVRDWSARTVRKYSELRLLFTACCWKRIGDVTPSSFSSWQRRSGLAPKTLRDRLRNMGTLFHWLERQRMAAENPLRYLGVKVGRRKEKFRRALSADEVKRLLSEAPHARAVVYLFAIKTGLRRNEIRQLVVDDFVLDSPAPFVRVRASTAKNPKETQQRLPPEVVEALRTVIPVGASPTARVFVVPKVPTFKRDLAAAGIPFTDGLGRRLDFHSLRDTFGTLLAAAGVPPFVLKELMRHSTVQQSERYYIDATQLPLAAAIASLPRFEVTQANPAPAGLAAS